MADNDIPQRHARRAVANRRREPLDAEFEIVIAEGSEGEMLARRQAEVLWEITKWQISRQK